MNAHPFETFSLGEPILRAVKDEGYQDPTPIQLQAIPQVLAGRDVLAAAQTGTGKTAAFALPILEKLHTRPGAIPGAIRALVLTPTRELAMQVEDSFRTYGRHLRLRTAVVVGGVSMNGQLQALSRDPAVLVATPGRLIDLMEQGEVQLDGVEVLVLDEADRMLDMGFIHSVRRIAGSTPKTRQTLLFSATLSQEVATLAFDLLKDPIRLQAAPAATVADNVDEKVMFVEKGDKNAALTALLRGADVRRALVFTRTKHRADRVARHLSREGISADAIHSNKSQNSRIRALRAFDDGKMTVLVATDVVSRGIDVEGITHVINYELPEDPASYVHRIGRTARAGAAGTAVSLCDSGEVMLLREIEKITRKALTAVADQPFHSATASSLYTPAPRSDAPVRWRSFGPGRRR